MKLKGKPSSIKIGDKYGRWVVLKHAGKLLVSPKRTVFLCRCECGTEKLVDAGNLKKPGNKSCGCLRREQARKKGKIQKTEKSFLNVIYCSYKGGAKRRGYSFNLTIEDFNIMMRENCFYCDSPPSLKESNHGIPFPINGLDRMNNDIGYELDNIAPCCTKCNIMKRDMNYDEFCHHIDKIAKKLRRF